MGSGILTWLSTYVIIIICELGDKTQLAVLLLTGNNPGQRWLIFAGSSIALTLCVLVEVTVGLTLARYVGPALLNRVAGGVFLLLGMVMLARYAGISGRTAAVMECHRQTAESDIRDAAAKI